jgi:protein-disulfide isomerase
MLRAKHFILLLTALVLLTAASPVLAQTGSLKTEDVCLNGSPSAPVRFEVFSDYQCPTCRIFYLETILPLLKEYGSDNRVCVIYHDFPLKVHKYAFEASRYAVASLRLDRKQGLRVSEALYVDQPKWAVDGKIEATVARVLSADEMAKVKTLLEDPSLNQFINQEIALAGKRQVLSTPTFVISAHGQEQKVVGKISYPILKEYLDRLLKSTK